MQLVLPSVATLGDHMASFNWLLHNQLLLFEELSRGDTCGRMLGIFAGRYLGSRAAAVRWQASCRNKEGLAFGEVAIGRRRGFRERERREHCG